MIVQIKRIILLLWLFYLPGQVVFSQFYSSKDNYTGAWETPASWNPTWTVPQTTNLNGYNITINGYITINGSLSFSGTGSNLIINDTLVIKGNLLLENNTQITINDNGILIVRGNLTISNQSIIMANGYLIVTGDIIKNSSLLQGPFTSNDNPVKVFIGGTISPVELTDNYPNFPVLNCTTPITTPYPNSTCSYGNMTDMISDPINSFFQYTCTVSNVNSNISVCAANTINLTSSGGTSYSWSGPDGFINSAQNPSIPNADIAMAGAYMITVIAAPGCTDTDTINVTVNALPIATAGSNSPVCVGNTINLTSSGGISYSWGGPKGFINSAQNPSIPNVSTAMAGTYTVTVTAATGCKVTKTTTVIVNALPIAIAGSNSPVCMGNIINLTSSGGTGYNWSGPNGFTSSAQNQPISNANTAKAGTYTVTVTAATGCTATNTTSVIVNPLPIAIAGSNSPVCEGTTINLTSSGGTGYSWSGPDGFTSSKQNPPINNATTAAAGAYKVTVTAATGCTATNTTSVIVNASPIASITITDNSGIANNDGIICYGAKATLTASDGTGYIYSWSSGETTASITKGTAGTYTVTVTNANGCTDTEAATITVNVLPAAAITITDNSGIANNDGIICYGAKATLTASDGTGYIYSWSSGETTASITKGTAGTYTVTVTNANGCTDTEAATITVNVLPAAAITITDNSGIANNDGIICYGAKATLTASDGTGYIYSWSSGETTASITKGTAGTYTVTVTNANGCTDTEAATITVNVLPAAAITITDNSGIANNDGIICNDANATLTASGGTSYKWSSGETTAVITKGTAGTYTVTVTNANGCTDTEAATITVNVLPAAAITITDNSGIANNDGIICYGAKATLTASDGTGYIYSWSSGETTASITKGTAGTYTVTVTNANGCTDTATAKVVVNALPVVDASNNGPVFSFKALNLTGGPVGMTTYSWTGPSGFTSNSQSPSVSASALAAMAGVYTLTVTNASACTNTATTTVEVNELPVPSVITPNGDGKNDYFVIGEIIDQVELIIFNRWGNEEYTNRNYSNDWDGRNNKGVELPNDTYFYILKFESGKIKKGSVLIKR